MAAFHLLRVFCADDGSGGNPLAVFLDGAGVPASERQPIAAELGLSETVFVDDPATAELRIFTPTVELDFAGHPTVGTAWLLAREREPVTALHPPAGEVGVRYDDELTWISARPEWAPEFEHRQLGSPAEVDALDGPPPGHDAIGTWAWIDEAAGVLRARVFPVRYGIAEDEATGAAAIRLCATLGRDLDIHQGAGSRLFTRPLAGGRVELAGWAALDDVREYPAS